MKKKAKETELTMDMIMKIQDIIITILLKIFIILTMVYGELKSLLESQNRI